ncbi:MAG: hypothetical protein WCA35_15430 [Kovacikia sp.]
MSETTRGLLLGLLCILEFLEFLASPAGLAACLWIGFYMFIKLTFHASLPVAIAVSGLFTSAGFWTL